MHTRAALAALSVKVHQQSVRVGGWVGVSPQPLLCLTARNHLCDDDSIWVWQLRLVPPSHDGKAGTTILVLHGGSIEGEGVRVVRVLCGEGKGVVRMEGGVGNGVRVQWQCEAHVSELTSWKDTYFSSQACSAPKRMEP